MAEHSDKGINPENGKPVKRSTGWFGRNTIYAPDGSRYMTRTWIGRLRLHVFHRGDLDPDCHDHPWNFWTFPFAAYVEEVDTSLVDAKGLPQRHRQIVPAWRWTSRPATHCYRVLGRYNGRVKDDFGFDHQVSVKRANELPFDRFEPQFNGRKIVTLVWRSKEYRKWGFLKHRDGRWCWVHWKEYVFGGGKDAPCQ